MPGIRGEKYLDENGNLVLTGGLKVAETNKKRYGEDFYKRRGATGGLKGTVNGVIKGFARMTPEQVKAAGSKGGKKSKRGAQIPESIRRQICRDVMNGEIQTDVAKKYGVSAYSVRNFYRRYSESQRHSN